MIIAVVPAKGNSNRLPGKNLLPIGGKPMMQWAVDAACQSVSDQVWITTDSLDIWNTYSTLQFDITRSKIRSHLRTEHKELDPETGVLYLAKKIIWNYHIRCDVVVIAYANCPQIQAEDINKAVRIIQDGKAHEVRAMYRTDTGYLSDSGIWIIKGSQIFSRELSSYMSVIEVPYREIHTQEDYLVTKEIMEKKYGS